VATTSLTIRATIPAVKRADNPMPGSVLALRGSVRAGCRSVPRLDPPGATQRLAPTAPAIDGASDQAGRHYVNV
jgi:hypothetical protein